MTAIKGYLKHLREIPFFAGCTKKELEEIAQLVTPITVHAGTTFIHEGSIANEMVIIDSGSVTVRRGGRKIATLGPGSVVGELAIILDRPRDSSVTVDEDSELLVLDRRSFSVLLDDVPGLAKKLLYTMAHRLADNAKIL